MNKMLTRNYWTKGGFMRDEMTMYFFDCDCGNGWGTPSRSGMTTDECAACGRQVPWESRRKCWIEVDQWTFKRKEGALLQYGNYY